MLSLISGIYQEMNKLVLLCEKKTMYFGRDAL